VGCVRPLVEPIPRQNKDKVSAVVRRDHGHLTSTYVRSITPAIDAALVQDRILTG
jgi:hypothetical protein